eukprot:TRINITY_DN1480_c0_g1_i2.p1 TRINITY_DN1480_c0_g1~~TRINITY_DN1480_c0_g1_i2.p1  ORF type:complete len:294 (+),score=102.89 TRINITY_DN1480_c0_g1_i2:65-946(+)
MAGEQPKKPLTAFFLYLEENRPAIVKQLGEEAKVRGKVSKTAAEQWRELAADAKAPYEKKAAEAKAAYERELELFKQLGGSIVRKRKADKAGKDGKPKKDKDAPKKPAGGAYGQYLAQHREEIVKSLPAGSNATTDVAKAAGARWKALSEEEKKPYEEKYAAKMKDFQTAMEAYKAANAPSPDEEVQKTPAKRARKGEKTPSPAAKTAAPKAAPKAASGKRGPGAKKTKGPEVVEIDASVLAEAEKLGYQAELRNLASRQEVKDLGKPHKDLLEAIKASNGLVNPARRALLGA